METIQMYSIYDRKSERFDTPFFTLDLVNAKRKFIMSLRNMHSVFAQFPEEFNLIHIGAINIITGDVTLKENEVVMTGAEAAVVADAMHKQIQE